MKVTTSIIMASLATSCLAHRERHTRFHEYKRTQNLEMYKRTLEADGSLLKRGCGDMIHTDNYGSFPFCWGPCEGKCNTSSPPAAAAPAAAPPVAAPAAPAASSPAPAASSPAATNNNGAVNKAQENPNKAPARPSQPAAAPSNPAPSSSPAASSSSTSSNSGGSNKFVGLAYNTASFISGEWLTGDATWAYNWGYDGSGLDPKLQFVPMCHGTSDVTGFKAQNFASDVPLLSLNEPDMGGSVGGTATDPGTACSAHNNAFSGYSGNYVGSPAVSSSGAPGQGLDWLAQFQKACPSAHVDFVALHWYGGNGQSLDEQVAGFESYVNSSAKTVQSLYPGKKIWFTEFAAAPITDSNLNAQFLQKVMPALKSANIERIAPFMVGSGGALGTSSPSAAGKILIGV